MSIKTVQSKFNWLIRKGNPAQCTSYSIKTIEPTGSISLEKLLNPDACMVLEPNGTYEPCEQFISVFPLYHVIKFALLAECPRIETCVGKISKRIQVYTGRLAFDNGSRLYRFDGKFDVRGTTKFTIRYLCPKNKALCLYGVHFILEDHPDPFGINRRSNMLNSNSILNRAMIESRPETTHEFRTRRASSAGPEDASHAPPRKPSSEVIAKKYIDEKFAVLEAKLDAKLEAMESRQNKKLDGMMALLKSIYTSQQ